MNIRIFTLLLALLLISVPSVRCAPEEQDDNSDDDITTMTFLAQYEDQSENDLIQISLLVEAEGSSLKTALTEASRLVASITNIAESFCEENKEGDVDCNQVVDTSDFEVEVDYQKIRKQLQFSKFIVSHEIVIKVYATDKIGELADSLLKAGVTKIQGFQWSTDEEDDAEEGAIEAGKEKAHDMCFHLGMKLHRIVSIESVQEQAEEGGEEDEEEQEEEQEEAPLVYRFNVQCIIDQSTAAKKAEEQAEEDRLEALEEQQEKKKKDDDDDEDADDDDEDDEEDDEEDEEEEQEEKPKKKGKGKKDDEKKKTKKK